MSVGRVSFPAVIKISTYTRNSKAAGLNWNLGQRGSFWIKLFYCVLSGAGFQVRTITRSL